MQYEDLIYRDGDTLFDEKEAASHAFFIATGSVDIYRQGQKVYTANTGEFIGQSGVISGKPYGMSARAVGSVRVQKIEKGEFLSLMQDDVNVAMNVMKNMSAQIYNNSKIRQVKPKSNALTSDINKLVDDFNYLKRPSVKVKSAGFDLVPSSEYDINAIIKKVPTLEEISPAKRSFVSFLTSFLTGIGSSTIDDNPLKIAIAKLKDDPKNMYRNWIETAIAPLGRIKVIKPKSEINATDEREGFAASYTMLTENNADLLIWGGIEETGRMLVLRFSSSVVGEDFIGESPKNTLYIPLQGGDSLYTLLRAVSLSSIRPKDEEHQEILQDLLPVAINEAEANMAFSPNMANEERISNMICLGNCAYTYAELSSKDDFYKKAHDIYADGIRQISPTDYRNYFIAHKQMGAINESIGNKMNNKANIEEALKNLGEAAGSMPKERNPLSWAEIEYNIANCHLKKAMLEGREEDFVCAINTYQSTLDVYSFEEYPMKWAEVINSIGKTLQVYGEINRDLDALKRAIKMCRQVLQIRSKESYPLLWANAQNNLGAALFLLSRHIDNVDNALKAIDAFTQAKEVYEEAGAVKMATVVAKNLVRAEDFVREMEKASNKDRV